MSQKFATPAAPQSTPRMGPELTAQLAIYLLRQPAVGAAAAPILAPEHFTGEPHYRVLWSSLLGLKPMYPIGSAPFDALYLTVAEAAAQPSARVDDAQRALLLATSEDVGRPITDEPDGPVVERPGILWHAYHGEDAGALDPGYGIELLKRFLHERAVIDRAVRMTAGAEERVPGNFESALAEVRSDMLRIGSIGKSVRFRLDAFPDAPEPVHVFTTGVGFLDELMSGGQVSGEMYMLFGLYKSGKTFLAGNVANGTADYFRMLRAKDGTDKHVAYFSYELTGPEMARRLWSGGADILLDRLEGEIRGADDYSTRGRLLEYEREYYKKKGFYDMSKPPGERERLQKYAEGVGRHISLFDMLNVESADVGAGGIDEVVALLNQMVLEGKTPGMVIIDNVFFAAHRTVNAKGGDWERMGRGEVSSWVTKSITHVARKFKVPVWLLHQYNADANQMKPGKRLHSTQSAESRTVGAHANMLLCMGARDEKSNVAQLVLDLARRGKNGGMRKLIQLEGDMARWHDVSDNFEIATSGEDEGRIIQKVRASIDTIDPAAVAALSRREASPDPYKAAARLGAADAAF